MTQAEARKKGQRPSRPHSPSADDELHNTTGPSRELSVGDVVVIGEVALAAGGGRLGAGQRLCE